MCVVCTGDPNSNWAWYEKQKMVAVDLKLSLSSGDTSGLDPANHDGTMVHSSWNRLGKSVVMNNERIGVSSDFWNNYAQDIRLAKELGMSCHTLCDTCHGAVPGSSQHMVWHWPVFSLFLAPAFFVIPACVVHQSVVDGPSDPATPQVAQLRTHFYSSSLLLHS